jgi:hypothetical protein
MICIRPSRVFVLFGALTAAAVAAQLPEIKRYLKIEQM